MSKNWIACSATLSPKLGTSALREMLPNTCQSRLDVPQKSDLGAPQVEVGRAALIAVTEEKIAAIARGVQELRSGDEGDVRQEVERVLDVGGEVLRIVRRARQQRALHGTREVRVLPIVDGAVVQIHAGDEMVLESADAAVVGQPREAAVVLDTCSRATGRSDASGAGRRRRRRTRAAFRARRAPPSCWRCAACRCCVASRK